MQSQIVVGYIQGGLAERKKLKQDLLLIVEEQGFPLIQQWYEESVGSRKQFQNLRKELPKIDFLIVRKLSILVKTLSHSVDVFQDLKKHNVRLVVIEPLMEIDWKSPEGALISRLCENLNTLEDSRHSLRKKGIEKAKQKGLSGAPVVADDALKEKAYALRREGVSLRHIAAQGGVSYGTIQSLMKKEISSAVGGHLLER